MVQELVVFYLGQELSIICAILFGGIAYMWVLQKMFKSNDR